MKVAALLGLLAVGLTASPASGGNGPVPNVPRALAVGPNGNVYIADDRRNQILERSRDGAFTVVASGLLRPGGMIFAPDGTLYVADSGHNQVRAISPSGRVRVVAGNGKAGWVDTGTPARQAALASPEDVKLAPNGDLVIAATAEVLRLTPAGTLTRMAGIRRFEGIYGVGGPATRASVDGPDGLAFDAKGNLFLAGFNTKALLMVTPAGTMRLLDDRFYPRGSGGLVTEPNGSILAMDTQRVVRISPAGVRTVVDFARTHVPGVRNFLPNGIAVAPNGDVYLDTDYGNGWANRTTLIVVHPSGGTSMLWEAPK